MYSKTSEQQPVLGDRSFDLCWESCLSSGVLRVLCQATMILHNNNRNDQWIEVTNSQIMITVLVIFLQILLAKPEPSNVRDKSAVAVFKDWSIVGHVPINMAPILYQFLRREVNRAFVEVKGEKANQRWRLWTGNTLCLSFIQSATVYTKIERYSWPTDRCWTIVTS